MRKIVVALVVILTLTGVAIGLARIGGFDLPGRKLGSLLHIYGGLFFLVLFPLYAWDHVRKNRRWLRVATPLTGSGVVQLSTAGVLILTGVLLLLYGEFTWGWAREAHHWLTYLLAGSLLLHYFSPKRLPGPRRKRGEPEA